jgi:F-type H+-transporting ATPase subunit delta
MKNARAAIRYAKAILNLAKDSKEETAVNDDMLFLLQFLKILNLK